jgi:multiple sugar transport system substrate-binding protein
MKKYSKLLAILTAAFMLSALLLTGCGQGAAPAADVTADASKSAEPAPAPEPEKAVEPTTINFWMFWNIGDEPDSIIQPINDFNAANPDIKIVPTKLGWGDGFSRIQISIGSGAPPDVLELGSTWVGAFTDIGALSDLTPLVTQEIKDKFVNWNLGELDGKIYAFPWAVGTRALVVNDDLFAQAGVDPKGMKTWDDMLAAAKAIKEKCKVPGFNIAAGDPTGDYQSFGNLLYSAGGTYIAKDADGKWQPTLNTDASKKALAFYKNLLPYSSVDNEPNAQLAFENNKLGMFMTPSSFTGAMVKDGTAVKNWEYVPIPACPDTGKSLAFNGAEVLTIPEQCKVKEQAAKVLSYLADEKTATIICKACAWGILPSTKTAAQIPDLNDPNDLNAVKVQPYLQIMASGATFAPPLHKSIEDIGMRISTMIQDIFLNKVDAQKAIESCEADIKKLYTK